MKCSFTYLAFILLAFISFDEVKSRDEKYLLVEIEDSPPVQPALKPTWKPKIIPKTEGYGSKDPSQRGYEPRPYPAWKPTWKPTWKPHPLDVTPIPPIQNPTWKPKWEPTWKPKPYKKIKKAYRWAPQVSARYDDAGLEALNLPAPVPIFRGGPPAWPAASRNDAYAYDYYKY